MNWLKAIGSGLIGAATLTLAHEVLRRASPDAPRMDVLGMRAVSQTMRKMDMKPPKGKALFNLAMLGDMTGNALYYSLVGLGDDGNSTWLRGGILGLAAGLGAVSLPSLFGLGSAPSRRKPITTVMTVLLYLEGGIAAAAAYRLLQRME